MLGLYALTIGAVAAHAINNLNLDKDFIAPVERRFELPLEPRQTSTSSCVGLDASIGKVTACDDAHINSANWAIFDIDTYFTKFIENFGISDNFPNFFVAQQSNPNRPDVS